MLLHLKKIQNKINTSNAGSITSEQTRQWFANILSNRMKKGPKKTLNDLDSKLANAKDGITDSLISALAESVRCKNTATTGSDPATRGPINLLSKSHQHYISQ